MERTLSRTSVIALFACASSCSLRSLDHLRKDDASAAGAAGAAGAVWSATGGSAGTPTPAAGGSGALGGNASSGGSGSGSGSTAPVGGAGTAGTSGGSTAGNANGTAGAGGSDLTGASGEDGGVNRGGEGGDDDSGSAGEAGTPSCVSGESGCPTSAGEVAYLLRPGHAPGKCADIQNFIDDDGARVIQYTCYDQINQVFWAEDHGDGFIALRSALSGKCLEVARASVAPNAAIEMWSCTGNSSQLFQPVDVGGGLVQLVAKHSELLLDVGGTASTANVEPLVQNADDGNADMTWQLEPASVGAYITIAPDDERELRLRHDGREVRLEASGEASAEWKVVQGLANRHCVSFASRDDTDRYLRQRSFSLFREANDGTNAFALDATFCIRERLGDGDYLSRSFESESYPGYFLVRSGTGVALTQSSDSPEFRAAATFRIGQLWP
jgi:hypothetical protein